MSPARSVIVYDTNRDALARRLRAVGGAAPDSEPIGVSSRTAALLLAQAAPEGSVLLVDLFETDRVSLDRPGQRLIHRLVRTPATSHTRAVAWSAQNTPDVLRGVRSVGAHGFVTVSVDDDREADALRAAIAGEDVWPGDNAAPSKAAMTWGPWFEQRFGLAWKPWMEPILVRLASGRERSAVVPELVDLEAARSVGHAAARLRAVADALAGEHRNSPAFVATMAQTALAQIATHRTLVEQLPPSASLEQGARTLRTSPSLVRAAGITPEEIEEIVAIHTMIEEQRITGKSRPGAPEADRARNERRWAAGRRASALGTGKDEMEGVIDGTLARLDDALTALFDARQDDLYFPEARAAAALSLLDEAGAGEIEDVTFDGGARWRGLDVSSLALADDLDVTDLQRFATLADDAVLRRGGHAFQAA
ncbi:MAG: hypothetical protein AAGC46_00780 [Solirubrobacteraceae bacterium]|nr:hypothetical protein [Patulibacter sp.]